MSYPSISVVVPFFNEEECVQPLYDAIRSVCEQSCYSYEMVFVDDGSQDRTFELLEELHKQNS